MHKFLYSLTFRLTLWYAVIFALSSLAILTFVYFMLAQSTGQRIDQLLLSEVQEFSELYQSHGVEKIESEFAREANIDGTDRIFFRLFSPEGQTLAASDLQAWQQVGISRSTLDHLTREHPVFASLSLSDRSTQARIVYAQAGEQAVLQIGYLPLEEERVLAKFRQVSVMAILMSLMLAATIGWFMAKRALGGVERVRQTAISIGEGNLNQRVMVRKTGDEIDHLADAFNTMLDRIHGLVTELKEVTNNIAHDLRSPITRIRGIAETALTGKETLEDYREMAGVVIEESDRLEGIINTTLQIAEMESGVTRLAMTDVNLPQLVQDTYHLFQPVAEDLGIGFEVILLPKSINIQGDVVKLQRVMANLVDNALKYTPAGGKILLVVKEELAHVVLSVQDTGVGLPEADLPFIFDRFFRGDKSRSTTGNGLGLSLARAFVRAHGGEILVKPNNPYGTVFFVRLPRAT